MDKLEHFAGLLVDLDIAKQTLPILLDNGFDDWEQTVALLESPEILDQIGIKDPETKKQILAAIAVADDYEIDSKQQEQQQQQEEEKKQQEPTQEEIEEQRLEKIKQEILRQEQVYSKKYQEIVQKTKAKPITIAHLKQGTSKKFTTEEFYSQKKKNQEEDLFLGKLNTLSLNDKKFTSMEILSKCINAKIVHLFGNCLFSMDQSLNYLQNLTILHLQNNYIAKIENLEQCVNLEKLLLNNNYICKLEGLGTQVHLKELQISNQLSGRDFLFDEQSCAALGQNLQVLEINNSQITALPPCFAYMSNLQVIKMRDNKLNGFEQFLDAFKEMEYLQEIHLKGNPMSKAQKYRDKIVLMSKSLEDLDGKRILPKERQFLFQLWKKKNGLLPAKKTEEKKGIKLDDVSGQQIKIVGTQDEEYRNPKSYQKLNSGGDFRTGFTTVNSTKHVPNSKYY